MYSFLHPTEAFSVQPWSFIFYHTSTKSGFIIRMLQQRLFRLGLVKDLVWALSANHCAVVVALQQDFSKPGTGEPLILDNVIPRCVVHAQGSVSGRTVVAVAVPVFVNTGDPGLKTQVLSELAVDAMGQEHRLYSWWEILGLLVWSLFALVGIKLAKNPIRGGTICTEQDLEFKHLLEQVYGIVDPLALDKDTTYPVQLLLAFINSRYYQVYRPL